MKNNFKNIVACLLSMLIIFGITPQKETIIFNSPAYADTQLSGERIKDGSINLNTKPYGILPIINGGTGSSSFDAYTSSDFTIDFLTKTTDDLELGIHNLYFTNALSLGTTLTGLSLASSSDITSSDTMLSAFGKLQAQIDSLGSSAVSSVFGRTGAVTAQSGDYTTAIVADSLNKRYVTDANLVVIGNTSGTNTGDQTNVTGNSGTVTVGDAASDTTTFPLLGADATGSLSPKTDSGLTYNSSTNALTATTFVGALTGNADTATSATSASSATTATTATNATNTAITDDTTTNSTFYLTIVSASTGNLPQKVSSTKLTYNPSTGVLSTTSFTGAGTGLTGTASSLTAGAVTNGAYITANNAFTKQNTLTPQTLTSSSNHVAWDANNGNSAVYTATENTTLDNPTNLVTGTVYTFQFTQHASSAKTLAFGTKWKFVSGTPTITTTLSGVQYIQGIYDGTNINCSNPVGPFS